MKMLMFIDQKLMSRLCTIWDGPLYLGHTRRPQASRQDLSFWPYSTQTSFFANLLRVAPLHTNFPGTRNFDKPKPRHAL